MKIASFNINGVKARLPRLLEWLEQCEMDIIALQEIKSQDDPFPRLEFESRGWHVETHGQKGFNGVALLSRVPPDRVTRGLPLLPSSPEDSAARYITGRWGDLTVASIYLPNGNPRPGPKFDYKLDWMARLVTEAQALLSTERPIVLAGDYNIIPEDIDCHNPAAWVDDALTQPESRACYRQLVNMGYTDAIRQIQPKGPAYSYWDYQRGAWQKDHGIRIDHLMLSPEAADHLTDAGIDKAPRAQEKASDHTPVWCALNI